MKPANGLQFQITSEEGSGRGFVVRPRNAISGKPAPDRSLTRLVDCKTQSPADRELREQLHQHRYMMFQGGVTVREIAKIEGVNERQIYLSIVHVETRLPKREILSNRNLRNAIRTDQKLAEKYVKTLSALMDGKGGKNWNQRCRALAHFRRTVGMEAGAGLQVNTAVNIRTNTDVESSYEDRISRIRAAQDARLPRNPADTPLQIGVITGESLALPSTE